MIIFDQDLGRFLTGPGPGSGLGRPGSGLRGHSAPSGNQFGVRDGQVRPKVGKLRLLGFGGAWPRPRNGWEENPRFWVTRSVFPLPV